MNVNPGEMNKRIKIIAKKVVNDADGYPTETESTVHECYAKVSNMSGTEAMKSNTDFAEVKTRFMIRYTVKTLKESMIVKFNGENYEIEYINNYNFSNEYIEIMARKQVMS